VDAAFSRLFFYRIPSERTWGRRVIIVGDHGESLGEHGLVGHRSSLYREQIQVPLLVRLPGVTPAGRRIADVAGLQNLPATIAELTGLPHSPFPGVSLSRWWNGSAPEERVVVSEVSRPEVKTLPPNEPISQGWLKSATDDNWHFILQQHGNRELFNLNLDVREEKNLSSLSESQARMEEMQNQLERLLGFRLPRPTEAKTGAASPFPGHPHPQGSATSVGIRGNAKFAGGAAQGAVARAVGIREAR
jgi:arylsulfatase A-like enzyme